MTIIVNLYQAFYDRIMYTIHSVLHDDFFKRVASRQFDNCLFYKIMFSTLNETLCLCTHHGGMAGPHAAPQTAPQTGQPSSDWQDTGHWPCSLQRMPCSP